MNDVFQRLDDLEPDVKTLSEESENINSVIQQIEERLAELSIGVEASIQLYLRDIAYDYRGNSVAAQEEARLSYEKIGGRWGLWIREYVRLIGGDSSVVKDFVCRLLESSRNTRIDSLAEMDRLVNAINVEVVKTTDRIRAATNDCKLD